MGAYAESQQPDNTDYGMKTCPECGGEGNLENGYDEDGEPQLTTCYICYGSGEIEKDVEDETEDEWNHKCEE